MKKKENMECKQSFSSFDEQPGDLTMPDEHYGLEGPGSRTYIKHKNPDDRIKIEKSGFRRRLNQKNSLCLGDTQNFLKVGAFSRKVSSGDAHSQKRLQNRLINDRKKGNEEASGHETLSIIVQESKVFEDVTRRKREHPKVHCPISMRGRKKIKAFSVNSKERKQKCARIINRICSVNPELKSEHGKLDPNMSFLSANDSQNAKNCSFGSKLSVDETHYDPLHRIGQVGSKVRTAGNSPVGSPDKLIDSRKDIDTMDIHSGVMILEAPMRRKMADVNPFMRSERMNAVSVPRERKADPQSLIEERNHKLRTDTLSHLHSKEVQHTQNRSIQNCRNMIDLSRSPFGEEEPRRNYRFTKHFNFTSGQKQMPKIKFKLPELKPFLRVSGSERKDFIRKKLNLNSKKGMPDCFIAQPSPKGSSKKYSNKMMNNTERNLISEFAAKNCDSSLNQKWDERKLRVSKEGFKFFFSESHNDSTTDEDKASSIFKRTAYFPKSPE